MPNTRRRIANMSEILKESEKFKELANSAEEEKPTQEVTPPAQEGQQEQKPASEQAALLENNNTTLLENNNAMLLQNNNVVKKKTRMTDQRDAKMYYLDPGQTDKLDDLRREYKQRTGKKLNEQDFMRHIINHLTIDSIL